MRCHAGVREQYVQWGMSPEQAEEYAPLGIPVGPIDPDLDVTWLEDQEGTAFAILVNFACHAVACGPPAPYLISAGFPGFTAGYVEGATGATCLFTAGAGGDIRPYRSPPRGFEEPERIGLVLASGVLRAMKEPERINGELKVVSGAVLPARELFGMVAEKTPHVVDICGDNQVAEDGTLFTTCSPTDGHYEEALAQRFWE